MILADLIVLVFSMKNRLKEPVFDDLLQIFEIFIISRLIPWVAHRKSAMV